MGDEKLKQELFYMVKLASKYDFSQMSLVEEILRQENERKILTSVFGTRFKARIFDIAAGVNDTDSCVICGKPAENKCICKNCMDSILESDYAKNQAKKKRRINIPFKAVFSSISKNINVKKSIQLLLIFCLLIIFVIQSSLLITWIFLPDYNPTVEARVSEYEPQTVSDQNAAFEQLSMDFPQDMGYSIVYARQDKEYVGRFLLNKGDCCEELEDTLTEEECYDYFFTEPVFVFYISNIEEYSARVGLAEVSENGSILVLGSFNDGRRTDCHYKFR